MQDLTPSLEAQKQRLEEQALTTGRYHDFMYFCAVLRDDEKLDTILSGQRLRDKRDRLFAEMLRLEKEPDRYPKIPAMMDSSTDIWFFYSLAKFLLREDRFEEAMAIAKRSIERDIRNTVVLNLIIKYLVNKREHALASGLIDSALRRNPHQEDIAQIRRDFQDDAATSYDLALDVIPQLEEVCFYIPAFNVEAFIQSAIEGLLCQNYPLKEILVVNDGTSDNSMAIARRFPVTIVEHEENRGLAAARNTAFRHASAKYVGAIDTDAVPESGYTQHILMEFENGNPRAVGVGGKLVEMHTDTPPDKWRAKYLSQDPGDHRISPIEALNGSNVVFLREAVLEVGGYDERYRTNGEDINICRKLDAASYELTSIPYAVAHHYRKDTASSVLRTAWN